METGGGARKRRGFLDYAAIVIPGIGRVRAQKEPFARAWERENERALASGEPLWVALGDSMSQGIGAADISGGWVAQLRDRLDGVAVLNLSVTGARIGDVLTDQLPRLHDLGVRPRLVTLMVGANDMLLRKRRRGAPDEFRAVLDRLPGCDAVIATLPQGVTEAQEINAVLDREAAAGRLRVAEMRGGALGSWRGSLAEDFFHPNERGYARIAAVFEDPVRRSLREPRRQ
ncbi:SGNH/GDSL hydrolase family protein [Actinokineospora bangkokensis]|uniref:SGNH/GDSL hydrolase family protein n=1 Tax=Actinokineospora bangkokensis TaxID=1193682 RepID=UPI001E56FC6E|nr:SGNH/GDSL hydrolase family protein [Actinokineospora bangkokensis]